ncbi:hypothetical protein [Bifidobacterium favimelis]|uniref:XRE family transcriptional regulator n=1 Tax=Bifidobacterium favimelis TaxID=3122979 RepID=A0ABU8ZN19_9BIFI
MKVSGWAATDKVAMCLVNSWLRESGEVAGVKKLAAYLGCSYQTVYRMLKYEGHPLTLAQFEAVCQYFKKDPMTESLKVFSKTNAPTVATDDATRTDEISRWTRRQLQKVELADDVLRVVRKYGKEADRA